MIGSDGGTSTSSRIVVWDFLTLLSVREVNEGSAAPLTRGERAGHVVRLRHVRFLVPYPQLNEGSSVPLSRGGRERHVVGQQHVWLIDALSSSERTVPGER